MMHILPCERVRGSVAAYHDGELPIDEQVLIHSHLQECVACRIEASTLADLGDALRTMAAAIPGRTVPAGDIATPVIERVRVERQFSLTARVRAMFDDMHLVWAGLGATVATLICIFASAGVLQAANEEKPDSLAGIISDLASEGTNANPVRLGQRMLAPRPMNDMPISVTGEDGEMALSAVVTREGRIQNVELLEAKAAALQVRPDAVLAMLDAASRTRFAPAQVGGSPVAVNVVWLVTTTTVKGQPDYDLYLLKPPQWTGAVNGPALPPKRPVSTPKAPPAGNNDGLMAA